jgi:CheY-like chemotaxis protein
MTTASSATPPRVLIADDDPMILSLLNRVITRMGAEPIEAVDGAAAVARFVDDPTGFVAVILDHQMPKLTGVEAAMAIRAIAPTIPIIIVSGYLADATRAMPAGLPFTTLLQKPYTLQELRTVLAPHLAQA